MAAVPKKLVKITRDLSRSLGSLRFEPPTTHVYNPLEYARGPVEQYLERFARPRPRAIMLGMNPGPYGMAQTGVPFGEVAAVRDWLGIDAPVGRPPEEHPKRPIQGFDCPRSEVSGRRFWGWAAERFGDPDAFFDRLFVWNYCPLVFMEEGGRNRTPDKLLAHEREELYRICDASLAAVVDALQPEQIIGIGKFAQGRAGLALPDCELPIGTVLHPSPASPIANRGWAPQAEAQLEALGVLD
ncbi:MAG: single-stranded DNA-binding protein [Planctomycetes bacterium]|nr:single-stranded DNA-binding protein [Planctomycetota bacterium]